MIRILSLALALALCHCGKDTGSASETRPPIVFGHDTGEPKPTVEYCESIGKRYSCRFTCFCSDI